MALGTDCRFYRKKLPEIDELVRVKILDREDHGFRCVLLEYNNINGLVLLNELKRGRVRSYHKILKKNKEYTVLVLRVHHDEDEDEVAGSFIDLSLKAVPRDQLPIARERWEKSKKVHGIMRHVAHQQDRSTEELYELFGWPLADQFKYTYLGFKHIMNSEDPRAMMIQMNVPEDCIDTLYSELYKRMQPTPEVVRARITMRCFSVNAVGGIQHALDVGLENTDDELPIVIRVVAAPNFEICCNTMEPELGKAKVSETMELMKAALEEQGGVFEVIEQPVIERIVDMLAQDAVVDSDDE